MDRLTPCAEKLGLRIILFSEGSQSPFCHRWWVRVHAIHDRLVRPRDTEIDGERKRRRRRRRRIDHCRVGRRRKEPDDDDEGVRQDPIPHPQGIRLDHGDIRRLPHQEFAVVEVRQPPAVVLPPVRDAIVLRLRGEPAEILHEGRAPARHLHRPDVARGGDAGLPDRVHLPRRPPVVQERDAFPPVGRAGGRAPLPPRTGGGGPGLPDVRPEGADARERARGGGVDGDVLPRRTVRHRRRGEDAARRRSDRATRAPLAQHHVPPRDGDRFDTRREREPRRDDGRGDRPVRGQLRRVDPRRGGDRGRRREGAGYRRRRPRAGHGGVRGRGGRVPVRGDIHGADGLGVHGARVGAVGEAIDPEAGARDVRVTVRE